MRRSPSRERSTVDWITLGMHVTAVVFGDFESVAVVRAAYKSAVVCHGHRVATFVFAAQNLIRYECRQLVVVAGAPLG